MGGSTEQGSLRDSAPAGLRLIETMRWEPRIGVALMLGHMARLAEGCRVLGIDCDMWRVEQMIDAIRGNEPKRLRLTVGLEGLPDLTTAALPVGKALWRVGRAGRRIDSADPWRRIKSTERGIYDETRAALPDTWDEAVFLNERDEVAEGTITNLFLWRDTMLLTPPVSSGALPGVLRAELIRTGRAREAVLSWKDVSEGRLFVGNALRGLLPAEVI